jgi:cell division protein FtsB
MSKDSSENKPQVGDLKLPKEVKAQLQNNRGTHHVSTTAKASRLTNLHIGLILCFSLTLLLFIITISVVTGMESRLADLEDEVFYLEDRVSSLETDITNLESEISDTNDVVTSEIDSVQNCINDFIDVWAQRGSYALYCR